MTTSHILGFPRVGAKRELKFAQERYWRKELAEQDLFHVLRSYFRFTSGNRGNSCSFWF